MNLITFDEAIENSKKYKKRHAFLGNGFSISCRPEIFVYGKLLEQADFSKLSDSAHNAFKMLNTSDFEHVIKTLRDANNILYSYPSISEDLHKKIENDASGLKEILVQTIAKSHPDRPGSIYPIEYENCITFLKNFSSVYTLNYDLLIYWAYMHEEEKNKSDDGFRKPTDEPEASYVSWESSQSHGQNLWFLHGALHVFDTGTEIKKFTWKNTGIALIDQIRQALDSNMFPVFVAEGTSNEKLERIKHSDYLAKAYRSFQEIQGSLFVYGHSLAANDEHFLKLIEKGKIEHLYIGIYGNPEDENNKKIIKRANLMKVNRKGKHLLECTFYDSSTAKVWK